MVTSSNNYDVGVRVRKFTYHRTDYRACFRPLALECLKMGYRILEKNLPRGNIKQEKHSQADTKPSKIPVSCPSVLL
jgi:hypothetical protein